MSTWRRYKFWAGYYVGATFVALLYGQFEDAVIIGGLGLGFSLVLASRVRHAWTQEGGTDE